MATYCFTVTLEGVVDWTDAVLDRLYEAGGDDTTPGSREGVAHVDFHRDAASLDLAVASAIRTISDARLPARIARIDIGADTQTAAVP